MSKGFVTIPTDKTFVEGTKKYIDMWGADAIRDCDGVSLPDDLKQFNCEVYKAYFIIREDHEYANKHPEYLQHIALSSKWVVAKDITLQINLLENSFKESLEVELENYKHYFQVFDRTTGTLHSDWDYIGNDIVEIRNAKKYHEYSVNFFAKNLWDPVQVYNYFVNGWNVPKDIDMDPVFPEALKHMQERLESWLIANPEVTVVRFTTFFYNFFIKYERGDKQSNWDWHAYNMSASPKMFEEFKKEYGYEITLEDVIDKGTYTNKFAIPNDTMCKYIDMVQRKCCAWAKTFVDICHKYNRKAMMFDGDHRIGTEPYNPYFSTIGLDAVVGAPSSGVYIQQISNMPGVKYTEGRFTPYFFPNECPGDVKGTQILNECWGKERRGMLRKPIDRIGFGGYLKQVDAYPTFVKRVKEVCDEFRLIKENAGKEGSYSVTKIAIISFWGKMDSWMMNGNFVDDFRNEGIYYNFVLEALAGQPVNIDFISFNEVKKKDLSAYDCILTFGIPTTSIQGDKLWADEALVAKIREYVDNGGGLVGIGEPSGYLYEGKYFQLHDVLGVQKETGDKYHLKRDAIVPVENHFITEDVDFSKVKFSPFVRSVYAEDATVLKAHFDEEYKANMWNAGHVDLAVNDYGKGRAVYMNGLNSCSDSYRLLFRSILWAGHNEGKANIVYSKNPNVDVFYYENSKSYALFNNSADEQNTIYFDIQGNSKKAILKPEEILWVK